MSGRQSQLAIQGGPPEIPTGPPTWPPADDQVRVALEAAYADGCWGRYHGPNCEKLIDTLSAMHQVEHATLCCSGTVAVELALRGLDVLPDDEVILAGYDFPGNFRAIEAIGAKPVLVDIDPGSWCLDPAEMEPAFSDATKAIIVSHLHGGIVPMREVMHRATARGIRVVEDACQAPGATVEGRMAGTWGDVGVLSFGGSKLLTAGRGGAILTRRADVHQRIKIAMERGNNAFPLSELQAAVLGPQLEKLCERNIRRRESVGRLLPKVSHLGSLQGLVSDVPGERCYYKVAWRYQADRLDGVDREEFVTAVQAEGVAMDTGFLGFTRRSERRCRKLGTLEHSVRAADQTVLLHHPVLLEEDEVIDQVAAALEKVSILLGDRSPSS